MGFGNDFKRREGKTSVRKGWRITNETAKPHALVKGQRKGPKILRFEKKGGGEIKGIDLGVDQIRDVAKSHGTQRGGKKHSKNPSRRVKKGGTDRPPTEKGKHLKSNPGGIV